MSYKRPLSVLVVIHTANGQVLLLKRTSPADFWQSVTGSLKEDEGFCQAACREVQEETGIRVSPDAMVDRQIVNRFPILPAWRKRYAPDVQENEEHVFSLQIKETTSIKLNPREHSEYLWLPCQDAAETVWSYTNKEAILSVCETVYN